MPTNRLEYALLLKSTVSSLFKFFLIVAFTSHWLRYLLRSWMS